MGTKLAGLPTDARAFIDATMELLAMYMPGSATIEMMVGPNVKVTVTINGGLWSKKYLTEVLSHLTRYRKYFEGTEAQELPSTDKIMENLERILADHRMVQAASNNILGNEFPNGEDASA